MLQKLNDWIFAIARWRYAEGRYWEMATDLGKTHSFIRILKGRYKGVVYGYLKIDPLHMKFNAYTVINPRGKVLGEGYKHLMSRILLVILWNMYQTKESKFQMGIKPGEEFNDDDDDRETDSQESDPDRTLREKSSAVFDGNTLSGESGEAPVHGDQELYRQIQRAANTGSVKRNPGKQG